MNSRAPHILCVNPWIHDFAAFDFWAKPLGLLQIASILREHGVKVSYIDCLNRFHPKETNIPKPTWDGRGAYRKTAINLPACLTSKDIPQRYSRYGIEPEWFKKDIERLEQSTNIDLIFVTSLMTYWAPGVEESIRIIKKILPLTKIVLGGIYASLCTDHARKYSKADLIVTGSGFPGLNKIVKDHTGFDMGFEFETNKLNSLDTIPYPALDMQNKTTYVPLLTSVGCPFSCDYCASSFLVPKFFHRSPESVFGEIEHWYYKYKIKNFAFYDDALLINEDQYAFILFEKIINSDMKPMFYTPNALHIREITAKAAQLMYDAGFKMIRLGLETIDFENRQFDKKVKQDEFIIAIENLKKAGFKKSQIGAYLLCGLPGQSIDNIKRSFLKVKEYGIQPTLAYYTPIPHTKMWEKAKKHSKYDLEANPIFSNNSLFPCFFEKNVTKQIAQIKNL